MVPFPRLVFRMQFLKSKTGLDCNGRENVNERSYSSFFSLQSWFLHQKLHLRVNAPSTLSGANWEVVKFCYRPAIGAPSRCDSYMGGSLV
ncbi:hypothetical protein GDO81_009128 [Engystomops pustulosus]|uniref:Uncharacterized protein n=1 Tax=Engystomops pustulosus TaxID=76066 RepID=A0AAV7BNM2_ENGPU|nr:hypothetical protein GDO81_009128 [Engystomops pustulosus]